MAERVDGLLLDAAECELLAVLARLGAGFLEQRNGAEPQGAAVLVRQLAAFARKANLQASGPGESADAPVTLTEASSAGIGWIGARAAALQLRVTPQAARELARRGVLTAVRGQSGAWLISEGSVAAESARRGTAGDRASV